MSQDGGRFRRVLCPAVAPGRLVTGTVKKVDRRQIPVPASVTVPTSVPEIRPKPRSGSFPEHDGHEIFFSVT